MLRITDRTGARAVLLGVMSLLAGPCTGQEPDAGLFPATVCMRPFLTASHSADTLFRWPGAPPVGPRNATEDALVTDRPDFTEASSTVGAGVAQLEIGYTYVRDDAGPGSRRVHSAPEPLLRSGILADWLEMRVGWNYADERMATVSAAGSEDLYLGMKLGLTRQFGCFPEMALIPQMTVPTGTAALSADEVLPGLNTIYGWEISDQISTAGSTQFNQAVDDITGRSYTEWAQSWTVSCSLTETTGTYLEYFGLCPDDADTAVPEHYLNGGFTFLITPDLQWDIRMGKGLNSGADDWFAGTGLSIRFR